MSARGHDTTTAAEAQAALPFGLPPLDAALPGGGLARGALHEITPAGATPADLAAATVFAAAILARAGGPVLWCLAARDLFAPALAAVGLHPDRVIYVEAPDTRTVLLAMEDGLRHGGLGAVLGEVGRCGLTESRRLQLAAQARGGLALLLSRPPGEAAAPAPLAATTRWRIAALASSAVATDGPGRARWRVTLARNRGGMEGEWIMEAPDAEGRLALPARLAGRPAAPAVSPDRRAAG